MKATYFLAAVALSLSPSAAVSQESQPGSSLMGESQRVLAAMGKELNTIAVLTYCGKNGIAKELQDRVFPLIMYHRESPDFADVASLEDTIRYYREAHFYMSGFINGIKLVETEGKRDSLCKAATDYADEILSEPLPWVK